MEVGDRAPDFSVKNTDGVTRSLKDYKGWLALYFYPRDDTPGCTKEACSLRDGYAKLKKAGIQVVGVSFDDQESHQKFTSKYELPFELLSDTDKKVARAYGVYVKKNMYGKITWGIKRTTFLIKEGFIMRIFKTVDVNGHAQQIINAVKEK